MDAAPEMTRISDDHHGMPRNSVPNSDEFSPATDADSHASAIPALSGESAMNWTTPSIRFPGAAPGLRSGSGPRRTNSNCGDVSVKWRHAPPRGGGACRHLTETSPQLEFVRRGPEPDRSPGAAPGKRIDGVVQFIADSPLSAGIADAWLSASVAGLNPSEFGTRIARHPMMITADAGHLWCRIYGDHRRVMTSAFPLWPTRPVNHRQGARDPHGQFLQNFNGRAAHTRTSR